MTSCQKQVLMATGNNHVVPMSRFSAKEWYYTVTIQNQTDTVFDEIVLIYQVEDDQGEMVFLHQLAVRPGQAVVFRLGVCSKMHRYTVGFFIGNRMVARLPDEGMNMTPALASQLNPNDVDPCADSWTIRAS